MKVMMLGAVLLAAACAMAQTGAPNTKMAAPPGAPAAGPQPDPVLLELSQAGHTVDEDLTTMDIARWKADSSVKRQAQDNAQSVQRNLREALPRLILEAQAAPASIAPQFKLYRNLNALYDVMASLTESAGAFGKKEDYEALAAATKRLDNARRQLADRLEARTAERDAELARLRAAQRAAAAAAQPVKKIVIDDNEPAQKKKSGRKTKRSAPSTQPK